MVIVAAINILVDPFLIYGSGILRPFRANNYQWKAELFLAYDPLPEVIILGSSRVGTADPVIVEELTGKSCYNWGAPTMETVAYNAIIRMAVEDYNAPIEMVIVAADPEIFHPRRGIHPQAAAVPLYAKYLGPDRIRKKISRFVMKVIQTFSWEQTLASFYVIWREISGRDGDQLYMYRDDGLMIYTGPDESIASGTYDLEANIKTRLETYPDRNTCFTSSAEPARASMDRWIEFLDYCVEKNIEIYVYITPQHEMYREMVRGFGAEEIYGEITEFFRSTVEERGGIFRDYSVPENFGGDPEVFYDEVHPRKELNDLILRDMLSD